MNVIIEDKKGNRRVAPQNGTLAPGERVVDVARDEEFKREVKTETYERMEWMHRIEKYVSSLDRWLNLGLGDKISFITDALGIEKCARCEAWERILNRHRELGWPETVKMLYRSAMEIRQKRRHADI